MNKGPNKMFIHPKVEQPMRVFRRLLAYIMKEHRAMFVFVLFFLVLSAASNIFAISFVERIISYLSIYLEKNQSFVGIEINPVIENIVFMGTLFAISALATYLYNRLMITVCQSTLKRMRDELFSHMQHLPLRYFDSHTTGSVMSLYTNDIEATRQMISQSLPQLISSTLTIVGVFGFMLFYNWLLTLITVVFIVILFVVCKLITSRSSRFFLKQQNDLSTLNGYIEEMMEGQKVVKVFNHEEETKTVFSTLNVSLEQSNFKANMYSAILMPVANNIGYINFAFTAVVGALCFIYQPFGMTFTIGALSAFLLLNKNFSMPISQVSNQINFVMMALAGAKRVFDVMDEKKEVDEGYVLLVKGKDHQGTFVESKDGSGDWAWKHPHQDGTVTFTPLRGDVRFYDVDFGYDEDKMILHDLSLYAKAGQKIAFVGATGAGKTTITNLINRFYDIQDGKIRYDGINIKKIKKYDLRQSLGIVLQDTHLFSGTIRENICFGKPDASDEEVVEAAKLANADTFIRLLEKGYDTFITGDGGNLSQGQRQLLAIARAAIVNPPVLILDEATSSIDTYTEAAVQKGMDRLMKGRTVFVIAHRLSTVQNSDAIMVLEQGKIIERGSHEDLIALKGKYYQLYTGAFELE